MKKIFLPFFIGVVGCIGLFLSSGVSALTPPPACTTEYAPTCGTKKTQVCNAIRCSDITSYVTYSNGCEASRDGATDLKPGRCDGPNIITPPPGTGAVCPVMTMPPPPPPGCRYVSDGTGETFGSCTFPKMKLVCEKDPVVCPIPSYPAPPAGCSYVNDGETSLPNGCKIPKMKLVCDDMACTGDYKPVCAVQKSPPCPPGVSCAMVMPLPKTYGNSCEADKAGAKVLYNGECNKENEDLSCPAVVDPVCAMPPMPVCLSDVVCPQVMPIATTYSNRCEADKAKAKFLYKGKCAPIDPAPCPVVDPPTSDKPNCKYVVKGEKKLENGCKIPNFVLSCTPDSNMCPMVMPPVSNKPNCSYVANGEKKLENGCVIPKFVLSCALTEAERSRLDKLASLYVATAKRNKNPERMLNSIIAKLTSNNTERAIYLRGVLEKALLNLK